MTFRPFLLSLLNFSLLVMNLSANDSLRFEFFADKAELITPTQIVAPDLSGQQGTQEFLLLAKVEKGKVQFVEVLDADAGITSRMTYVLKTWQFSDKISGQFLLRGKLGELIRTPVYAIESLDNKPSVRVKAIPSYPQSLRAVISWKAVVEVVVDQDRSPVAANVLSSSGIDFVENARVAALLCRFETGLRRGSLVCYKTKVEIVFDATQ